ncbi:DUF2202 domain-containing protein [Candidatus Parcubacteria bacterium]|jgi:hypothetical protein|nr:DUF2202 domain-containing protein [Candidatus Parcubacteria bacterium]MBT3949065.1 DUF2202 domain-containing protein [Candidatus Parcubacteria bacterium]
MSKHISVVTIAFAMSLLVGVGCTQQQNQIGNQEVDKVYKSILSVDDTGNTQFNKGELQNNLDLLEKDLLSEEEKAGLLFMREEEKLAHDIYDALYEEWGQKIFDNISNSEQTHTDAVKTLIDRYGLEDPIVQAETGVFDNPDLQKLYDDLIKQSNISLKEAFIIGAIVEEVDILDLEKYLEQNDNEDIELVYNNLLRGSRNHLRAFVKNIENNGDEYVEKYLSAESYLEIIDGDIERGGVGHGNNSGRRNGKGR